MIITRSPLRISLGGGGTDLPSYYMEHGGFVLAGAIDKYVYVNVMRPFSPGIFAKYSKLESVDHVDALQHPIMREAIKLVGFRTPQLEISTSADIPAGTGLGSSGSFATALLKALFSHRMRQIQASDLAEMACKIEIELLAEPVGKQDQYIASHGGLTAFTFDVDGGVRVQPLEVAVETKFDLEENLLLFFTGFSRRASDILVEQDEKTKSLDVEMIKNLHYVKELGFLSKRYLEQGATSDFGALMHEHWSHKKRRSGGMTNPQIDEWYDVAMNNGALGGKLVGAGGGGFLLFYAEDKRRLREAMKMCGLEEVRFRFDFEGTKVLFS